MGYSQALKLGKKHIIHKITYYTYSNDNTGVAIEYNSGIKNDSSKNISSKNKDLKFCIKNKVIKYVRLEPKRK